MSGRRRHGRAFGRSGRTIALAFAVLGLATASCSTNKELARRGKPGFTQRGMASWYGPGFHGKLTANGEVYDMYELTAAHKYLPFESVVDVLNRDNGRSVQVRINDRGPFVRGRIIDLSKAAAQEIDLVRSGVAKVTIRVVKSRSSLPSTRTAANGWIVQAGAFRDRSRASSHLQDVAEIEAKARLEESGGWFRVVIGPFKRAREAESVASRLRRTGLEAMVRAIR